MDKNGMEELPHPLLFVLSVLGQYQYHKNWHHGEVQAAYWCRFNIEYLDYDHDLTAFILCFCVSTAYMVSAAALKK